MEETPGFDEAIERLKRFLSEQGWPTAIVWRTDRDVARLLGAKIVVRRRSTSDRARRAREYYEEGRGNRVGVAIDVVCELDGAACATIEWTTDSRTAELHMIPDTGLKLCVATPRRQGTSVGPFRWWLAARRALER